MAVKNVTVGDAMTRVVQTVGPSSNLQSVLSLLKRHNISGLPVVDSSRRVVGVISIKDVRRALSESWGAPFPSGFPELLLDPDLKGGPSRLAGKGPAATEKYSFRDILDNVKVREVMNQDPVVISPSAALDVAAKIMMERNINRLPVIERNQLVGILTRHDVLSAWV